MRPSISAFKPLSIAILLAAACTMTVLAPVPVQAIYSDGGSDGGGSDTGPGERSDVEIITFDTLLAMSPAGLKIVRNNPSAYKLKHPILAERHLKTLVDALIYAPNRTRRFFQRLARAKSTAKKQYLTEGILLKTYQRASTLDYRIGEKGEELRRKGHLVNYRTIDVFGQKSSDPAVQDLYRMHDQLAAQWAFYDLLNAASRQLSHMD